MRFICLFTDKLYMSELQNNYYLLYNIECKGQHNQKCNCYFHQSPFLHEDELDDGIEFQNFYNWLIKVKPHELMSLTELIEYGRIYVITRQTQNQTDEIGQN